MLHHLAQIKVLLAFNELMKFGSDGRKRIALIQLPGNEMEHSPFEKKESIVKREAFSSDDHDFLIRSKEKVEDVGRCAGTEIQQNHIGVNRGDVGKYPVAGR